jgi:hypothetical protein
MPHAGNYNVYCVRAQEDHRHACKKERIETNVQEFREYLLLEVALTNYPMRAFMMLRAIYIYRIAIAFFGHESPAPCGDPYRRTVTI